jgi:hypothetical protein
MLMRRTPVISPKGDIRHVDLSHYIFNLFINSHDKSRLDWIKIL